MLKWAPTGNTVTVNASDGTLTVTDDTTPGRIEFDYTDPVSTPGADVFIRVRITGIVAPFTSMVLVPADQEAAFDGGEKWDADFKTEAAQSRILRFMDTMDTNARYLSRPMRRPTTRASAPTQAGPCLSTGWSISATT